MNALFAQPGAPLTVDTALLAKHGGNGPRYTSYPTADRFVESFDAGAYRRWLRERGVGSARRSLGLYVHVPFCDTLCFYCACNKIATKDAAKARKYTGYLLREIELVAAELGEDRRVRKMHWGGGTPTFLSEEDSATLMGALRSRFSFDPDGEYVRRWVPELRHLEGAAAHEPWERETGYAHDYPRRIIDHAEERREALDRYQRGRG